jgi:hypothetical protein
MKMNRLFMRMADGLTAELSDAGGPQRSNLQAR